MGIKVIATAPGYYGQFRETGAEFEIDDEAAFHDSWMDRADGKSQKRKAAQMNMTGNNPAGALPRNPALEVDLS